MAPFGAASLARLAGVKPVTEARAIALAAYVTAHGGDIGVKEYGGLRSLDDQAQLLKWEQDSVAAGGEPYAVHAPNANAPHITGDAFDVEVLTPLTGATVDQTYLAMAQYAPTLGLIPGYFFQTVPSDPFHFENADRTLVDVPDDGAPDMAPSDGAISFPVVLAIVAIGLFILAGLFGKR